MSNESNELFKYLSRLAKKSEMGEINWNQPNLSTFQWVEKKDTDVYTVTIQKVNQPISRKVGQPREVMSHFMFQVRNAKNRTTSISLSSRERPELRDLLAGIFEGAEKGADVRTTSVLKDLLGE